MGRAGSALQQVVSLRATGRCEYCHFPESAAELPFHCDHIIAEKHSGPTNEANLAWACFSCNVRKGPNIGGLDPVSGELTRLFHPRTDDWPEHFEWQQPWLRGRTPVGRTTIAVLDLNHEDALAVRRTLMQEK